MSVIGKRKVVEARKDELLPVSYFHSVLTIPSELNALALINQKEIYDILFKSGTETLRELGRDPKHLGAEIGIIAILHTWGQKPDGASTFTLYSTMWWIV